MFYNRKADCNYSCINLISQKYNLKKKVKSLYKFQRLRSFFSAHFRWKIMFINFVKRNKYIYIYQPFLHQYTLFLKENTSLYNQNRLQKKTIDKHFDMLGSLLSINFVFLLSSKKKSKHHLLSFRYRCHDKYKQIPIFGLIRI